MKENNVLITGATGFIGKELVKHIYQDYNLSCFVRPTSKIEELKRLNIKTITGDLETENDVLGATKDIEILVHLANSHLSGKENRDINILKNIVSACKKNEVKKLIFLSSMATKRNNPDYYGKSKLKMEKIIKDSGIKYTILRPSIIYGKDNLSLIGKSLKFPLFIPVIGNGKYKLNPIYIKDVIEAISKSLNNKKSLNKSYDLAGGKSYSFNEIIGICKKRFNIKRVIVHIPIWICLIIFKIIPIISQEAIKGINEDTLADITSLRKDLKINPVDFMEGIKNVHL